MKKLARLLDHQLSHCVVAIQLAHFECAKDTNLFRTEADGFFDEAANVT